MVSVEISLCALPIWETVGDPLPPSFLDFVYFFENGSVSEQAIYRAFIVYIALLKTIA